MAPNSLKLAERYIVLAKQLLDEWKHVHPEKDLAFVLNPLRTALGMSKLAETPTSRREGQKLVSQVTTMLKTRVHELMDKYLHSAGGRKAKRGGSMPSDFPFLQTTGLLNAGADPMGSALPSAGGYESPTFAGMGGFGTQQAAMNQTAADIALPSLGAVAA